MSHYKLRYTPMLIILLFFLTIGCEQSSNEMSLESTEQSVQQPSDTSPDQVDKMIKQEPLSVSQQPIKQSPTTQVVYTANIQLTVTNFERSKRELEKRFPAYQGYLVNSSENHSTEAISGHLTIRIPHQHFQSFLTDIQKMSGTQRPNIHVTGTDVTEEMVDLKSRLNGKEAMEKRLLNLMNQADKTSDLLSISKQLDMTQSEIEQIKGRIQYLTNQVDYATFHISIHQPKNALNTDTALNKQLHEALASGWVNFKSAIASSLIFMVKLLPWFITISLLGLITYLFIRYLRKSK
ncbi:DUF4349 domain-containing protein [Hazenella sp. IB182357]|uniref:DUF4349 domain-containing protein n=1 Tax=Polycladospora coralii TaxID=2771432 RepID=A0A926RT97_9BACL|nr:DUF4349 domain-containing protein [Polycladospora coralii]MBD1370874.1 DUF4349 domain-containing protein [Polycladospora coralii]MBS7529813.1 DUF4349 domain-containing protein [Polycladospora coralii]